MCNNKIICVFICLRKGYVRVVSCLLISNTNKIGKLALLTTFQPLFVFAINLLGPFSKEITDFLSQLVLFQPSGGNKSKFPVFSLI